MTLIGTTDVDYEGDPRDATATPEETAYLCAAASGYFKEAVQPDAVLWSFAGVRPLQDESGTSAQEASRDFALELVGGAGEPALLNVIGGKITTYRHLAEQVAERLRPLKPALGPDWTASAPLPGGDFAVGDAGRLEADLQRQLPFLPAGTASRLIAAYGTMAGAVLGGAVDEAGLGRHFGAGLYEREVEHLTAREWARSAEDILWRRSKLGLHLSTDGVAALRQWLETAAHG